MRPIDADAFEVSAHERYCAERDNYAGLKCRACWVDDMLGDVADAPTISPDEARGVVHCCNCYHAEPRNPVGEKTEIFCRLFIAGMREDDFCSRGEFLTNCGARMKGAANETADV